MMKRKQQNSRISPKLTPQLSARSFTDKSKNSMISSLKPLNQENQTTNIRRTSRKNSQNYKTAVGFKRVKEKVQNDKTGTKITPKPTRDNKPQKLVPPSSTKSQQSLMLGQKCARNSSQKQHPNKSLKFDNNTETKRQTKVTNKSQQQIKDVRQKIVISMFRILCKISQSPFWVSFKAIHIETGLLFCLKVFNKEKIHKQGLQDQLLEQVKFRLRNSHPNMQSLYTVFRDEVNVYFLEEFVYTNVQICAELKKCRRFNEKQCGNIFKGVISLLQFIHSQGYIHRDIRVQNIVRTFGVIKVVDFNWIAALTNRRCRDTFCGSKKQAPPELLQGQSYDESIDIWCLGVLLYELSTGISPFSGSSIRSTQCLNFPISMSNELVDLLGKLLSAKQNRLNLPNINQHEWTQQIDVDGFINKQFWNFWTSKL